MKYKLALVYQGVILARSEIETDGAINIDSLKCKAMEVK